MHNDRVLTDSEYHAAMEIVNLILDKQDDSFDWILNFLYEEIEKYYDQDPVMRKYDPSLGDMER